MQVSLKADNTAGIRELMDILEQTSEPEEFMENTRLEMYHDQVFCFTPRGDLLALPQGRHTGGPSPLP